MGEVGEGRLVWKNCVGREGVLFLRRRRGGGGAPQGRGWWVVSSWRPLRTGRKSAPQQAEADTKRGEADHTIQPAFFGKLESKNCMPLILAMFRIKTDRPTNGTEARYTLFFGQRHEARQGARRGRIYKGSLYLIDNDYQYQ